MRAIGIRELRQHASRHLRRVEAGETIEVTDRGRPVALLVPIPARDPVERLRAAGRLEPPARDLLSLGEPLEPRAATAPATEILAGLRSDER